MSWTLGGGRQPASDHVHGFGCRQRAGAGKRVAPTYRAECAQATEDCLVAATWHNLDIERPDIFLAGIGHGSAHPMSAVAITKIEAQYSDSERRP